MTNAAEFSANKKQKINQKPKKQTIMSKKMLNLGGAEYLAPTLRNVTVRCEAGFEQSAESDGVTEEGGIWDTY